LTGGPQDHDSLIEAAGAARFASMGAVLEYLGRVDPEAARRARYRYGCFDGQL
jgi:erythromycin esterase-like protein